MPDSISEQLQEQMTCEGVLECFHGLNQLDKAVYRVLVDVTGPLTVDDVTEVVDRERSTTYRSMQRLLSAGVIQKDQVNYENGGYCHVYRPTDPSRLADDMYRALNDWYAKMGQLIGEFERKYENLDRVLVEN